MRPGDPKALGAQRQPTAWRGGGGKDNKDWEEKSPRREPRLSLAQGSLGTWDSAPQLVLVGVGVQEDFCSKAGAVEEEENGGAGRGGEQEEEEASSRGGRTVGGGVVGEVFFSACLCRVTGNLERARREQGQAWRTTTQQLPRPTPALNPPNLGSQPGSTLSSPSRPR